MEIRSRARNILLGLGVLLAIAHASQASAALNAQHRKLEARHAPHARSAKLGHPVVARTKARVAKQPFASAHAKAGAGKYKKPQPQKAPRKPQTRRR